jgi:hypothetical protein
LVDTVIEGIVELFLVLDGEAGVPRFECVVLLLVEEGGSLFSMGAPHIEFLIGGQDQGFPGGPGGRQFRH